jgi:hypothetical protein
MKEETVEHYVAKLKAALEVVESVTAQIAEEAGVKTPEQRKAFELGMTVAPQPKIKGPDGEVPLRKRSGEVDWKTLREMLLKAPEPSREQKEAHLKSLNSVPSLLKRAFAKTAKKLPHAPGGHPFALKDPEQRLAICKLIEAYRIDNHMDTAEAVTKVASELKRRQRSVSTKTLRRYYEKFLKEQGSVPTRSRKNEVDKKQRS